MDKGFEKFMSTAIGQTNVAAGQVNMDFAVVEAMANGIVGISKICDNGNDAFFSVELIFATLANTFNDLQDAKFCDVMVTSDNAVNGTIMTVQQHLGKRYSVPFLGNKGYFRAMLSGMVMAGLSESLNTAIKTTDVVATGFTLQFERGSLIHKLISISVIPDEEIAKILSST